MSRPRLRAPLRGLGAFKSASVLRLIMLIAPGMPSLKTGQGEAKAMRSPQQPDAHLKSFGIVYDDVQGEARIAPVYDLVTTFVCLPKDSPHAERLYPLAKCQRSSTPGQFGLAISVQ